MISTVLTLQLTQLTEVCQLDRKSTRRGGLWDSVIRKNLNLIQGKSRNMRTVDNPHWKVRKTSAVWVQYRRTLKLSRRFGERCS